MKLLRDVAERAVMTFIQAFLSVFVVADLSTAKGAVIAGVAAALAVVKGFVASRIGDSTASLVKTTEG